MQKTFYFGTYISLKNIQKTVKLKIFDELSQAKPKYNKTFIEDSINSCLL